MKTDRKKFNVRKIKVIDDSRPNFVVNQKYLAYIDKSKSSFKVCSLNGEVIDKYTKKGALSFLLLSEPEELVWTHIMDEQGLHHPVIFSDNQIQVKEKPYLFVNYLPDDHSRYERIIQEEQKIYQKRDFNKNLIWEYPTQNSDLKFPSLNYCFFRTNDALVTLDNHTGQELWRYSLPEGDFDYIQWPDNKLTRPTIRKIIGVYREVVWFSLDSGALVGLDVKTGALVKCIVTPDYLDDVRNEEPRENNRGSFFRDTMLDHEQGVIFTCNGTAYVEVDLNQDSYLCRSWNAVKEFEKQPSYSEDNHFWVSDIAGWEGNTVYIFDRGMSNCFGAFDRKTRTILWSKVFDGMKGSHAINGNSKYSNNHFYIQSSDKKLHIYEISEV